MQVKDSDLLGSYAASRAWVQIRTDNGSKTLGYSLDQFNLLPLKPALQKVVVDLGGLEEKSVVAYRKDCLVRAFSESPLAGDNIEWVKRVNNVKNYEEMVDLGGKLQVPPGFPFAYTKATKAAYGSLLMKFINQIKMPKTNRLDYTKLYLDQPFDALIKLVDKYIMDFPSQKLFEFIEKRNTRVK